MEIVFDHVSYVENHNTSYKKEYLKDVSFKIEHNKITGIITKDETAIPELITAIKRPTNGFIEVDDLIIKKNIHITDINLFRKRVAVINCNLKKKFLTETVKDEIGIVINNYGYQKKEKKERIIDSLKMVNLDENYLDRNPNNLSYTEQNKINFASILSYNPEVLIFTNYEMGMSYKEKENFKRLIKMMKNKYNKTIILITNNVEFLMDFVDNYIVIHNNTKVLEGTKKDFYNDELYKYTEMPKIIDFVKTVQGKNHNIDNYVDIKELIKGIYRDVQ